MVESSFLYNLCFNIIPWLLFGLLGLGLGWLLFRGKTQDGDLSVEGEGALRAEADGLRTRVRDLEGRVSTRDGEVSDLKTKLAAAAAGAAAATAAAKGAATLDAPKAEAADDDETYALEWRNRYLAARVKYLEGRLSEAPAPKAKKVVAKKKAAPKAKLAPVAKKKAAPKAKAAPKPKVLYTDGPTDGAPDDLKLIKGIGPKFEGDLNSKGIYYFRQIGAWKAADVKMVEGVIDSIPGRIARDEWVRQAKGLSKGAAPKAKKKAAPKAKAKAKAAPKPKVLYTDGPTDGAPDDLKLIKGIGPKFEGDLNAKGIYYFRQIAAWKAGDVKMVEGVIDSIPGRIKRDKWVAQAKGLSKATSTKKTATAKKKTASKTKSSKTGVSPMDKYYANVKKHDKGASRDVVENIVKYCGIALRSRDTSLVACSDKTEVATVVNGFVAKKLGIKDGGQALVEGVCQDMKGERFKNRVTFYYLCAKKAGKLSLFK